MLLQLVDLYLLSIFIKLSVSKCAGWGKEGSILYYKQHQVSLVLHCPPTQQQSHILNYSELQVSNNSNLLWSSDTVLISYTAPAPD